MAACPLKSGLAWQHSANNCFPMGAESKRVWGHDAFTDACEWSIFHVDFNMEPKVSPFLHCPSRSMEFLCQGNGSSVFLECLACWCWASRFLFFLSYYFCHLGFWSLKILVLGSLKSFNIWFWAFLKPVNIYMKRCQVYELWHVYTSISKLDLLTCLSWPGNFVATSDPASHQATKPR